MLQNKRYIKEKVRDGRVLEYTLIKPKSCPDRGIDWIVGVACLSVLKDIAVRLGQ
jgi:hypothetical protein